MKTQSDVSSRGVAWLAFIAMVLMLAVIKVLFRGAHCLSVRLRRDALVSTTD
jgi:hypothetical protein